MKVLEMIYSKEDAAENFNEINLVETLLLKKLFFFKI
jgi:hypothetical protein